jgi:hypothetical protein
LQVSRRSPTMKPGAHFYFYGHRALPVADYRRGQRYCSWRRMRTRDGLRHGHRGEIGDVQHARGKSWPRTGIWNPTRSRARGTAMDELAGHELRTTRRELCGGDWAGTARAARRIVPRRGNSSRWADSRPLAGGARRRKSTDRRLDERGTDRRVGGGAHTLARIKGRRGRTTRLSRASHTPVWVLGESAIGRRQSGKAQQVTPVGTVGRQPYAVSRHHDLTCGISGMRLKAR